MKSEILDRVDKNDEIIGSVTREKAHTTSTIYHREISVILFNNKGETLLQQRSQNVKLKPGMWTVACAGHVDKGEDPFDTANREVLEELGIKCELKFYCKNLNRVRGRESRFFWIYYGFYDKNDFQFDRKEVEQIKWVSINDLDKFRKNNDFSKGSYQYTIDVSKFLGLI